MAKFKYKKIKHMNPRPGVKYATDYYKQTPAEYTRTYEHIKNVIVDVVSNANKHNITEELYKPQKGFPRTNKQPNYSMWDIMADMLDQFDHERDLPSGMLGRWNKIFGDNEALTIDMEEDSPPNPLFNQLFY